MEEPRLRPLFWVSRSKKDYLSFPLDLRHDMGFLLYRAQQELPVPDEKPLNRGALQGLGIREIAVDGEDGTYRVVYTVKLRAGLYVLHAFQKKSKRGIATPQHDIELIRDRFTMAMRIDEASSPL